MDASPTAEIERLTDDLRKLVGWGVWTMRLLTLSTLCKYAEVDSSLSVAGQASSIRRYLIESISKLTGTYEFQGEMLEGETLRIALRLLLEIPNGINSVRGASKCKKPKHVAASTRRLQVIRILGIDTPLLQFRRPTSPEREVLRLLAVHLVNQSAS